MRIYEDIAFSEFKFWGGAKETVAYLTDAEGQRIFDLLENDYECQPLTRTDINDFFWFETDYIAQDLGYKDWEALLAHLYGYEEEESEEAEA
jgi:hypothetical protein